MRRLRQIDTARPTPAERLWTRINKRGPKGCWLWRGPVTTTGYARLMWNGKSQAVHRVVYELLVGPIPEGLELDHLCRVRACCNPAHLQPVTGRTNKMRGTSPAAEYARRDACHRGHKYEGDNFYLRTNKKGYTTRVCRICSNINACADQKKRNAALKSAGLIGPNNLEKTHCPQGHPYSGDNLRVDAKGHRSCKECGRIAAREYARRKRAAAKAT